MWKGPTTQFPHCSLTTFLNDCCQIMKNKTNQNKKLNQNKINNNKNQPTQTNKQKNPMKQQNLNWKTCMSLYSLRWSTLALQGHFSKAKVTFFLWWFPENVVSGWGYPSYFSKMMSYWSTIQCGFPKSFYLSCNLYSLVSLTQVNGVFCIAFSLKCVVFRFSSQSSMTMKWSN